MEHDLIGLGFIKEFLKNVKCISWCNMAFNGPKFISMDGSFVM